MRQHLSRDKKTTTGFSIPSLKHPTRGFGLESSAISPQAVNEVQPLHKPVTHDISRISLRTQAKLSISQPGDFYEQEADSVAQQVMQRMAQPVNPQSIQRQQMPEEELQMKPLASYITPLVQRQEMPSEKELHAKPVQMQTLADGQELVIQTAPDLIIQLTQWTSANLTNHFNKHSTDTNFAYSNQAAYAQAAINFVDHPSPTQQVKTLSNGCTAYYDTSTDNFAVVTPSGNIKTFFQPGRGNSINGEAYFNRQT